MIQTVSAVPLRRPSSTRDGRISISTLQVNGLILSGIFWILAVLSLTLPPRQIPIAVPAVLAAVFCALSVVILIRPGGVPLLSPFTIVIGTIAVAFGVRPLYLLVREEPLSYAEPLASPQFTRPLLLVVLFIAFFGLGYSLRVGRFLASRLPSAHRRFRTSRVLIVWCVLAALAALLYLLMLRNSQMTLREAFMYPINFRSATTVGGLYYVSGCALWCLWSLFWLPLVAMIGRPLSSIRIAILLALFGFAALFTFPYGSRGALLIPVIGVAGVVENTVLHKPLNILKLAPIVGALVIATGLLGVTRVVASSGPVTSGRVFEALQSGGLTSLLDHSMARFDTFDFLAMVVNKYIASGQHFLAGRSFFDLLIQPVPRSLYPDKPSQTSAFLTGIFYPELGRIWTPEYGMIAELYINFWVFGVVIGAVLFGILIRALDDYLQRHRHSPAILFWYAPLVTIPMSWTMSGFNSFASVVFVLDTFLAVVVLLLLRRRRTATTIPA